MRAGGSPPATHVGPEPTPPPTRSFNEGRGFTPGDTIALVSSRLGRTRSFNEGRGFTPGDTVALVTLVR